MAKKNIYLDYAATTPIEPKVLKKMLVFLKNNFGNPSSIHSFGQEAKTAIEEAREKIASSLNCSSSEVFFTGSATEANNIAILGIVRAAKRQGIKNPHIIVSQIEHHAVLEPCRQLEKEGAETTYLPVDKKGLINLSDIKKAIKKNTVLVSIMYANNEIGSIQPIGQISRLIGQAEHSIGHKIYFHTDAVQAFNYLNCDVKKLGVDLLTLSGHKIYGPKGIGALYVRQNTPLEPVIFGGGQEQGLRPGTENTASIIGFAEAVQIAAQEREKEAKKIKPLRDKLIKGLLQKIPGAKLNGPQESRLPNNVNISIPGIEGESMLISLDQEGIAASTGSACSSRSLRPSHVLLAIGLTPKQAHGSLRFSLGKYTTRQDIEKVLAVLPKIVKRLREISPFKQNN